MGAKPNPSHVAQAELKAIIKKDDESLSSLTRADGQPESKM